MTKSISTMKTPEQVVDFMKNQNDSYGLLEKLPSNLKTEQVLKAIAAMKYESGEEFPRQILWDFPENVFTPGMIKYLISNDPDAIFTIPNSKIKPQMVVYAIQKAMENGGFTSPPSDFGLESIVENLPETVLTNPAVKQSLEKYGKFHDDMEAKLSKEREEIASVKSREEDSELTRIASSLKDDGTLIAKIPKDKRTPEMIHVAVQNNPKAVFQLDPSQRTKDVWLLAAKGDPKILDFVRPLELQAEIKDELNVNEDLERIKRLGGI